MLDDGAGRRARRIELGDTFVGRVGIVDVVVGELLALRLPRGRDAEARIGRAIERRRLVRVLAVAQLLDQPAAEGAIVGRDLAEFAGEPIGDRRVIGRRARIGLGGKLPAQRQRGHAVMRVSSSSSARVIAGIDHHRDIVVVLGGGADHGRAADIDVLDAGFEIGLARDGFLERIEIDHQNIDRRDPVRPHRFDMRRIVADREQTAVHRRMQRLDAAVHHFRETGQIADVAHFQPGIGSAPCACRRSRRARCRSRRARARIRPRRFCRRRK